jgi:glycosyltransferase involved in cell wall biosynthesis
MKIVVAGPVGGKGGLQTHYEELIEFLRRDGHEVAELDVCISNDLNKLNLKTAADTENVKIRVGFGAGSARRFNKLMDWIRAAGRLRRFKPEVLISVSNGYGYAFLGYMAPKNCFSVRTEVTDSWKKGALLHEIMARAYQVTAVQSPALMRAQKEKLSSSKPLAVLPCFSRMDVNEAVARKPAKAERLRLAFFGRLAQNKGLIEILTVLSERQGQLELSLDIWGGGVMLPHLEYFIKENKLEGTVALKGAYPGGDALPPLLASYHGLVLPSQYSEGLPLVLLEAASVGLPFLSCDIGAISDCEDDNPDCRIVQPDIASLGDGFFRWCKALESGEFEPKRLKSWFSKYHSRAVYEHIWRSMLTERHKFFNG